MSHDYTKEGYLAQNEEEALKIAAAAAPAEFLLFYIVWGQNMVIHFGSLVDFYVNFWEFSTVWQNTHSSSTSSHAWNCTLI